MLRPYIRGEVGNQTSPYATAGAYFAHGLIHANQFTPELHNFFMDGYRSSAHSEPILHGVSLGLGVVGMATRDEQLYEKLKETLYNHANAAVVGEAAAYGMGLVMVGSGDENAIEEMMTQASESEHEKIIRALSISSALVVFGLQEKAEGLIE